MENWFGWRPSGVDRIVRDLDVDLGKVVTSLRKNRAAK